MPRRGARAHREPAASTRASSPSRRGSTSGLPGARPARRPTNRACARCHQVLFSRYPFTWEGAHGATRRRAAATSTPGRGATSSSAGARARWRAPPATIPTRADAPGALAALATPAGNRVCTNCHAELAAPETPARPRPSRARRRGRLLRRLPHAAQEHGPRRHADALPPHRLAHRSGAGPRGPSTRVRALPSGGHCWRPGRPHGGVVAQAVSAPAAGGALRLARRERDEATLERGKAHEQAVAVGVLGRDRTPGPRAHRAQLVNEYPLVREWAKRALDALGAPAATAPPPPAPPGADAGCRKPGASGVAPAGATPPPPPMPAAVDRLRALYAQKPVVLAPWRT